MTTVWGGRRTARLVDAARAGDLIYGRSGLVHRGAAGHHIAATARDKEIVVALIDLGLLRHDEETGAVTAGGAP